MEKKVIRGNCATVPQRERRSVRFFWLFALHLSREIKVKLRSIAKQICGYHGNISFSTAFSRHDASPRPLLHSKLLRHVRLSLAATRSTVATPFSRTF